MQRKFDAFVIRECYQGISYYYAFNNRSENFTYCTDYEPTFDYEHMYITINCDIL